MWKVVQQHDDGAYWLDPQYFSFHHSIKSSYTRKFTDLFGDPREPETPFFTDTSEFPSYYGPRPRNFDEQCRYNQYYADIAASVQAVTEELILRLVSEVHRQTGLTRLCLAGGVALNSVANGRILRETPFKELYVQPSAGDGGGALGAALFAWHCALGNSQRFVMDHAYWGQAYSPDDIQSAISRTGVKARYIEDDSKILETTVEGLLNGQVVGWFQGRFEWGPCALGNRSILADPRRPETKDVVNTKIKFREPFRPFAPAVLVGESENYFDLPNPRDNMLARFMLLVVPVHEKKGRRFPR